MPTSILETAVPATVPAQFSQGQPSENIENEKSTHWDTVAWTGIALTLAIKRLHNDPEAIAQVVHELQVLASFCDPEMREMARIVSSVLTTADWQALSSIREHLEGGLIHGDMEFLSNIRNGHSIPDHPI